MKSSFLLLLVSPALLAAPLPEENIRNMVAQNDAVMAQSLCRVANDTKPRPGDKILLIGKDGAATVSVASYNRIKNTGYKKTLSGEWVMNENIRRYCRKDKMTEECTVARFSWDASKRP